MMPRVDCFGGPPVLSNFSFCSHGDNEGLRKEAGDVTRGGGIESLDVRKIRARKFEKTRALLSQRGAVDFTIAENDVVAFT